MREPTKEEMKEEMLLGLFDALTIIKLGARFLFLASICFVVALLCGVIGVI